MNDVPCRVSIDERNYQRWLEQPEEEYWDEEAAMEKYYEDKDETK